MASQLLQGSPVYWPECARLAALRSAQRPLTCFESDAVASLVQEGPQETAHYPCTRSNGAVDFRANLLATSPAREDKLGTLYGLGVCWVVGSCTMHDPTRMLQQPHWHVSFRRRGRYVLRGFGGDKSPQATIDMLSFVF